MQKLDIQCDMCDVKFSLMFPADESDPIICPFCADYLDAELQGNMALIKNKDEVSDLPDDSISGDGE